MLMSGANMFEIKEGSKTVKAFAIKIKYTKNLYHIYIASIITLIKFDEEFFPKEAIMPR